MIIFNIMLEVYLNSLNKDKIKIESVVEQLIHVVKRAKRMLMYKILNLNVGNQQRVYNDIFFFL